MIGISIEGKDRYGNADCTACGDDVPHRGHDAAGRAGYGGRWRDHSRLGYARGCGGVNGSHTGYLHAGAEERFEVKPTKVAITQVLPVLIRNWAGHRVRIVRQQGLRCTRSSIVIVEAEQVLHVGASCRTRACLTHRGIHPAQGHDPHAGLLIHEHAA